MIFPCADQGIEIVLSISCGKSRLSAGFRCVRILLREPQTGLQHER
jgi:hypothetical protein